MIIECILEFLNENNIFGKQNLVDFKLQDNGEGVFISEWNIPEIEEPNLELIQTQYSLEALKLNKIELIKQKTSKEIKNKYSIEDQLNITNEINGFKAKDKTDMIAFVTEKLDTKNTKKDLINACTTEAELDEIEV